MKLSDVPLDKILGTHVKGVTGTLGYVSDVYINPLYKEDDEEKNPMVVIEWDNDGCSIQPLMFMYKVEVL